MGKISEKYNIYINKEGIEGFVKLDERTLTVDFLVDNTEFRNISEISLSDLFSEERMQKILTKCVYKIMEDFLEYGCIGEYTSYNYKTIAIANVLSSSEGNTEFDFSEPVFTFSINQKKLEINDLIYGFKFLKKYLDKRII